MVMKICVVLCIVLQAANCQLGNRRSGLGFNALGRQIFSEDDILGVNGDEIPGEAGVDYPVLSDVPSTGFTCDDFGVPGYYADQATACQVYYRCGNSGRGIGTLCPNGTIFNQETLVCDWWYNFNCDNAVDFYDINADIVLAMEEVDAVNAGLLPNNPLGRANPLVRLNGLGRANGLGRVDPLGRVNGLGRVDPLGRVNGLGRVDPLGRVNGLGLVDPLGRVNGLGRVDPLGRVNGLGRLSGLGLVDPLGRVNPASLLGAIPSKLTSALRSPALGGLNGRLRNGLIQNPAFGGLPFDSRLRSAYNPNNLGQLGYPNSYDDLDQLRGYDRYSGSPLNNRFVNSPFNDRSPGTSANDRNANTSYNQGKSDTSFNSNGSSNEGNSSNGSGRNGNERNTNGDVDEFEGYNYDKPNRNAVDKSYLPPKE